MASFEFTTNQKIHLVQENGRTRITVFFRDGVAPKLTINGCDIPGIIGPQFNISLQDAINNVRSHQLNESRKGM